MPLDDASMGTKVPSLERQRPKTAEPDQQTKQQPPYNVIIWNDDTHTYEYVIELLIKLFGHSYEKAYQITDNVHHHGRGIAYTTHRELAELKRDQIHTYGPDWRMENSTSSIRASIEPAFGSEDEE